MQSASSAKRTTSSSPSPSPSSFSWQERMDTILQQDRDVQNFVHYQPSQAHLQRMQALAKTAPHLYDNQEITPRSQWFQHKRYSQNSQMPPFHVHFRQEMQQVLQYLKKAAAVILIQRNSTKEQQNQNQQQTQNQQPKQKQQIQNHVENALHTFLGSMRGLHGHVSIEEYACFPLYQQEYPEIFAQSSSSSSSSAIIHALVQDHETLKRAEHAVAESLQELVRTTTGCFATTKSSSSSSSSSTTTKKPKEEDEQEHVGGDGTDTSTATVLATVDDHDQQQQQEEENLVLMILQQCITTVLDFDDQLMAHLGEEEEIVVPLSLTEKDIWF